MRGDAFVYILKTLGVDNDIVRAVAIVTVCLARQASAPAPPDDPVPSYAQTMAAPSLTSPSYDESMEMPIASPPSGGERAPAVLLVTS